MPEQPVSKQHHASFEGMRQIDEAGNEFWSARDLAPLLEYQQWRNFMQVIDKARQACEKSGRAVATILLMPAKWLTSVRAPSMG